MIVTSHPLAFLYISSVGFSLYFIHWPFIIFPESQNAIKLEDSEGSLESLSLRPPPRRPMPIKQKITPALLTEPPPPKEIMKPPALPPKETLNIPAVSSKEAQDKWWSNTYANAPPTAKNLMVPKERMVGKETMQQKPVLLVQTPSMMAAD